MLGMLFAECWPVGDVPTIAQECEGGRDSKPYKYPMGNRPDYVDEVETGLDVDTHEIGIYDEQSKPRGRKPGAKSKGKPKGKAKSQAKTSNRADKASGAKSKAKASHKPDKARASDQADKAQASDQADNAAPAKRKARTADQADKAAPAKRKAQASDQADKAAPAKRKAQASDQADEAAPAKRKAPASDQKSEHAAAKPNSKSKQAKKKDPDEAPKRSTPDSDAVQDQGRLLKLPTCLQDLLKDPSLDLPALESLPGHFAPPEWIKTNNLYSACYKAYLSKCGSSSEADVAMAKSYSRLATRFHRECGVVLPELMNGHQFRAQKPAPRAKCAKEAPEAVPDAVCSEEAEG